MNESGHVSLEGMKKGNKMNGPEYCEEVLGLYLFTQPQFPPAEVISGRSLVKYGVPG